MVQAHLLAEIARRVAGITEVTREKVSRAVDDGIKDGLGAAELGRLIESSAAFAPYRAEVIARTETNRVLNVSQLETFKHYGVERVQAIDGDDDAECAARDGRIYTVDEAANIEDHPNGTLDWAPLTLTEDVNPTPPAAPELPQAPVQAAPDYYKSYDPAILDRPDVRAEIARLEDEYKGRTKHGSPELYALAKVTGADGLPALVDRVDDLVKQGWRGMYRGVETTIGRGTAVAGRSYAAEFQTGDYFPGRGSFGNGTYAASWDIDPASMRVLGQHYDDGRSASKAVATTYAGSNGELLTMALHPKAKVLELEAHPQLYDLNPTDLTQYAFEGGYDAIHIASSGYWNILNRTALAVERTIERTPVL